MKAPKTQILFLTAALMFGAAVLRLTWIENQAAGEACRDAAQTVECMVRGGLVQAFHYQIFGWLGLGLGFIALLRPQLLTAGAALILAGWALIFYTTDLGAGGFVLGLMALARVPVKRPGEGMRSLGA